MDIINVIKKLNKLNISELKLVFKKIYKNKKCPHFKKDIIIKLCEPFQMKYKIGGGRGGGRGGGHGGGRGGSRGGGRGGDITDLINMFTKLKLGVQIPTKNPKTKLNVIPVKEYVRTWNNSECNGGYKIDDDDNLLGKGADGWVYKAKGIDGKKVAIKVINISSFTRNGHFFYKTDVLNSFSSEIKLGLLGAEYEISPKIYDWWLCEYKGEIPTANPWGAKPNAQSDENYGLCSDFYPSKDPFGEGCKNVDTGFIVMERLTETLYDYIIRKSIEYKYKKIASKLHDLLKKLERCIFFMGIYPYDAHPGNWMLNKKGTLYMTDFGRIMHIKDIYETQIKSLKVKDKVVIYRDISSKHDEAGKKGIIKKFKGSFVEIELKDKTTVKIPKENILPLSNLDDLFNSFKRVIKKSVCFGAWNVGIKDNLDKNPLYIICSIFQNINITFHIYEKITNILKNWDDGITIQTVMAEISTV